MQKPIAMRMPVVCIGDGGFALDARAEWLADARRSLSPNRDARPEGAKPSLLVVHGISLPAGEFGAGHPEALFLNRLDLKAHATFVELAGLRVSAHLLINRVGLVTQFVPFTERAWHAGVSCYEGRGRCNDFSIGIELEGTDDVAYTGDQYRTLGAVARALLQRFRHMSADRIVGHSDISPGRKTDPGPAFDWPRFRRLLAR